MLADDLSMPDEPRIRPLPSADAGEFEWLLYRQHGLLARAQALEHISASALARRLRSGRWQRAGRGVYLTHNGPVTERQRLWAAVLAVGWGRRCLLAGLSALRAQGLRRFDAPCVDVIVAAPGQDRDPPAGVVVHRTTSLPDDDCRFTADPPSTTTARAVVDAAQWARTEDEARAILATTFQQRLVTGGDVDRVLDRMPRARRRALIVSTLRDVRAGSQTITELDLVSLCRRYGLPVPTRQVIRTDASGRKRFLDALFEEWGIRVEVDGVHHMDVSQWWRDMERHNDLVRKGEIVLRFPGWKLRHRPAEVAATLRRALLDAGWRPRLQ